MGKKLEIYTDGSHFKGENGSGRLGIGGVLIENGSPVNEFSEEIKKEFLEESYDVPSCSNPTMEMLAVLFALRKFAGELETCESVILRADYEGVINWNTGTWKIKAPYIKKIKEEINKEIERLGLSGKLSFEWVKAHQKKSSEEEVENAEKAKWNNYVDKLAKGKLD